MEKLAIYKALIDEGRIRDPKVTYNQTEGTTVVMYEADEHIRDELRKRTREVKQDE